MNQLQAVEYVLKADVPGLQLVNNIVQDAVVVRENRGANLPLYEAEQTDSPEDVDGEDIRVRRQENVD